MKRDVDRCSEWFDSAGVSIAVLERVERPILEVVQSRCEPLA